MVIEEDIFKKKFNNCVEVDDLIAELEEKCPDKRTKEYVIWKEKLNLLFQQYNTFVKFTCFKPIK